MRKIITLCPCIGENHCPEIFSDDSLPINRQIEMTDDFGNKIFMSKAQFDKFTKQIIKQAKNRKFS